MYHYRAKIGTVYMKDLRDTERAGKIKERCESLINQGIYLPSIKSFVTIREFIMEQSPYEYQADMILVFDCEHRVTPTMEIAAEILRESAGESLIALKQITTYIGE